MQNIENPGVIIMTYRRTPKSGLALWRIMALVFVVALVALAACSQANPMPTPSPEVQVLPTMTGEPTFTAEPSATPTIEATATLVPTASPVPPTVTQTPTPSPSPTPTMDASLSPLTGLHVDDPALLSRRVLAVRVGNDPNIRPQEGLGLADIVYEEVMDGWSVTRFTALYLESDPKRIRPVRSARLSSLAIAPQYDAALVHSGASDRIRWLLSQAGFVNLDEFFDPKPFGLLGGYDWRGRLYTSAEALRSYLKERDLEATAPIKGYTFNAKAPEGRSAVSIHIPYPSSSIVDWKYEPATGRYLRSVQGQPHLEALTKQQIAADNVIILYAEHKTTDIVEDTNGATAIDIVLSGSGRAQLCRDGVVVDCRWEQKTEHGLIQYYDNTGKLIPLRPGKTWIQLVPTDYSVTVQ